MCWIILHMILFIRKCNVSYSTAIFYLVLGHSMIHLSSTMQDRLQDWHFGYNRVSHHRIKVPCWQELWSDRVEHSPKIFLHSIHFGADSFTDISDSMGVKLVQQSRAPSCVGKHMVQHLFQFPSWGLILEIFLLLLRRVVYTLMIDSAIELWRIQDHRHKVENGYAPISENLDSSFDALMWWESWRSCAHCDVHETRVKWTIQVTVENHWSLRASHLEWRVWVWLVQEL
jgi:hypothetical protein